MEFKDPSDGAAVRFSMHAFAVVNFVSGGQLY